MTGIVELIWCINPPYKTGEQTENERIFSQSSQTERKMRREKAVPCRGGDS